MTILGNCHRKPINMNTFPAAFPLNSVSWMKLVNNYVGGEPAISMCCVTTHFYNAA